MSTRARIGMMLPNDMIVSINCYKDGYPEHLGQILSKHYATEEKIKELMKGGNLMDIETTPELCHYEQKAGGLDWEDVQPQIYRSLGHFINDRENIDYLYIFYKGKWSYDSNQK